MELYINPKNSIYEAQRFEDLSSNELVSKYLEFFSGTGYIPEIEGLNKDSHIYTFGDVAIKIDFINAKRVEILYNQAIQFAQNQQFHVAELILKDILEICPRFIAAIRTLVKIALHNNDLDEAFDICIDGLRLYPKDNELLNQMAYFFSKKDMAETSLEFRKKVIEVEVEKVIASLAQRGLLIYNEIFEPLNPLYSEIQEFEGGIKDYYVFSEALVNRNNGRDIEIAFELMVSVLIKLKITDPLRIFANDLMLKIGQKFDEDNYIQLCKHLIENVKNLYGFEIELIENKNLPRPTKRIGLYRIEYNPDKSFYAYHIIQSIIHIKLVFQSENQYTFSYTLNEENKDDLFLRIQQYLGIYYHEQINGKYLESKANAFFKSLSDELERSILDYYIYKHYPPLRPLQLGAFLYSFKNRLDYIFQLLRNEKYDVLATFANARKAIFLSDSYLIQQCYGAITMWDICPIDNDTLYMQDLYEDIVYNECFKNIYIHVQNAINILELDKYFNIEIYKK